MILTRDPATRRLAARILLAQAASTAVLAATSLVLWGGRHGYSALAGGAIGLVAQLYMTLAVLRPTRSAGGALVRLIIGQLTKVGLTAALFVLVGRTAQVAWVPLLVAYVAALMMVWVAALSRGSAAK